MTDEQIARDGDVNLGASWAAIGRSAGGRTSQVDTVTLVATGIEAAFLNGAYVTAPTSDPRAVIAAAIEFFAADALPWLLWCREGADGAVLDAGRVAGLRDAGGPPGMALASIPSPPPAPVGLEIRQVTDAPGLDAHREVLVAGYEMPHDLVDRFIRPALLDQPGLAAVVGSAGGRPVSTAMASISGMTVGVYNVATCPDARGRGYGAALTWAAVAEGLRRGCTHAVLQSSTAGYPVYRGMGFVDVGRYVQLEGPPR